MTLTARVHQLLEKVGAKRLMAVTKYSERSVMLELIGAGVKHLGENRLQDLQAKVDQDLQQLMEEEGVTLHFIGHLQTNKVAKVLQLCDQVDSVDSLKLASKMNQVAVQMNMVVPIMLQVNLSGEEQKSGLEESELDEVLEQVQQFPCLDVRGLMCIGKQGDLEESRQLFKRCKQLADTYGLPEVSMGMSQDYQIALEEGSTMVRLGRVLVG